MIVYALKSDNQEYESLIEEMEAISEVVQYNEEQALILDLEQADAVLLDLDVNTKSIEKLIKSLRRVERPRPIIVLSNRLEEKKLQKHQSSRAAADIYLTYPIEQDVLKSMIEQAIASAQDFSLEQEADQTSIIQHQEESMSEDNQDELDLDLESVEQIDLSEEEESSGVLDLSSDDEIDLGEADLDLPTGGDDFSDADDSLDFSIPEDGGIESDSDVISSQEEGAAPDFSFPEDPADEEAGTNVGLDQEPISLDDDITMGGIDLSGLEASQVVDKSEIDETRALVATELSDVVEDDSSSLEADENLSSIQFNIGEDEENEGNDDINMVVDEEDDFQTKLREIDEMLKDDASVTTLEIAEISGPGEVEGLDVKESLDIEDVLIDEGPHELDSEEIQRLGPAHDGEFIRLGETIRSLRMDREQLLKKVEGLEKNQGSRQDHLLTVQAQLDEKKIENSIMKKRYSQQIEDLNVKLELMSSKKAVLEEKNKQMESEYQKLRKEQKLDVNRVRSRERELEDKLDLMRKDAEVQVRNRDQKILELKRQIDGLEFDIENAHLKERQSLSDQALLEEKMTKVISTLRSAIGQFEDNNSLDERKKQIKKNLDV